MTLFKKLLLFAFLCLSLAPSIIFAQSNAGCENQPFGCYEAPISDSYKNKSIDVDSLSGFIFFINEAVTYGTAIVVIIGLIMIVVAGYIYMTAGGDSGRVTTAKTFIGSALLGIALALAAVTILNLISPQFAEKAKEPSEVVGQ